MNSFFDANIVMISSPVLSLSILIYKFLYAFKQRGKHLGFIDIRDGCSSENVSVTNYMFTNQCFLHVERCYDQGLFLLIHSLSCEHYAIYTYVCSVALDILPI